MYQLGKLAIRELGVWCGESKYEYKNVKPNDAVKVEEYDGFYDLDYLLQVSMSVQSKNIGSIEISTPPEKSGIGEMILLWDTMENGHNVSINKL